MTFPLFQRVQRWTVRLAGLAALTVLVLYAYKVWIKTDYSDFLVYHRTALRMARGEWEKVYSLVLDGNCPYRYFPLTLPFFRPLALLPYDGGRLVWFFFQYFCFAWGFASLHRILGRITATPEKALFLLSLAMLYSLRFCIDSFMIGQVTGTMFLCISLALEASIKGRPGWAGALLAFPAMLKVGPALLYGPLPSEEAVHKTKSITSFRYWLRRFTVGGLGALSVAAALVAILGIETASRSGFTMLFVKWKELLYADSSFFDASHYGSQSIKSALLRMAQSGWLRREWVSPLHMGSTVLGCFFLAWLWFLRRPKDLRTRCSFLGLGVLGYLLFMPFTFKYSLPLIAFPVAFRLAGKTTGIDRLIFIFSCLMLPLAGPIFIGESAFFFLQKASFPVLAILLFSYSCAKDAWRGSEGVVA